MRSLQCFGDVHIFPLHVILPLCPRVTSIMSGGTQEWSRPHSRALLHCTSRWNLENLGSFRGLPFPGRKKALGDLATYCLYAAALVLVVDCLFWNFCFTQTGICMAPLVPSAESGTPISSHSTSTFSWEFPHFHSSELLWDNHSSRVPNSACSLGDPLSMAPPLPFHTGSPEDELPSSTGFFQVGLTGCTGAARISWTVSGTFWAVLTATKSLTRLQANADFLPDVSCLCRESPASNSTLPLAVTSRLALPFRDFCGYS